MAQEQQPLSATQITSGIPMTKEEAVNNLIIVWVTGTLIIYLCVSGFGILMGSIISMPLMLMATALIAGPRN